MREFKIDVNEKASEYLERLSYEISTRSDIITMLLENHKYDEDVAILESNAFKTYSEQLGKLKAEFELAKREFADEYIPDELKNHQTEWNLDYKTHELIIKLLCNCEVKCNE